MKESNPLLAQHGKVEYHTLKQQPGGASSSHFDRDAVHFGVRMSVCITLSSLFILLRHPGQEFPEAMWILITVLFVCWFPTLDAASVVEKSIQRLYGTAIGTLTGLTCGFLSLALLGENCECYALQSGFLILCLAAYTFMICWGACHYNVERNKIITRYNYACILSLLTFYICVLPFYTDNEPKWEKGMYRVTNVVVGCLLGAGLSISILPRSTTGVLRNKMELQVQLAGEASQAVLHEAAGSFSDSALFITTDTMDDEILDVERPNHKSLHPNLTIPKRPRRGGSKGNADICGDVALEKYEAALKEWRTIQTQLNNVRFDPLHLGTPDELLSAFRSEVTNTLARALRIQNTVVLLDGILRNDPKHDFSEEHVNLFASMGTNIRRMLSLPLQDSNEDAYQDIKAQLSAIRSCVVDLSSVVASSSKEMPAHYVGTLGIGILGSRVDLSDMLLDEKFQQGDDKGGKGAPKFVHGSRVCALLFLQLVEHLALRSVRLYQTWKQCQAVCDACENRGDFRSQKIPRSSYASKTANSSTS